jgi:hypothetical protein
MKFLKIALVAVVLVLVLAVIYGMSPIRPDREVFTFTMIDAPKEQVWQVLTNFGAYRQWNPLFTEIDGKCVAGARINVQVRMDERTMTYTPTIKSVKPQAELAWSEQLIVPGIFDGEHRFQLESTDNGQTRFVQHDHYSGALVPLLMEMYEAQAESGFRRMNDALKKRAEQAAADAQR